MFHSIVIGQEKENRVIDSKTIVGIWSMCKDGDDQIQTNRNHCPEIIFLKDGSGIFNASDPPSRFNWYIKNEKLIIWFDSIADKKHFFSSDSEFNSELYNENEIVFLKLFNKTSTNWYLLGKDDCN